ncbi:MAG: tetratricopeptide repeat protein [Chitinophagaceae bacterium]
MGNDNYLNEEFDDLKELLLQFAEMKAGRSHSFLDEDSFEQIIDYYDEHDDLVTALQATEMAMEHFPFSSTLQLKKANLLIESKQYREALKMLERAELLDTTDINLYILKTEAFLGLNEHEQAVSVLENQIDQFDGEDRTELLLELADVYDDWEEFEKVFDCLKLVLEQDPGNEEALHKICFWTEFSGRNEESIRLHDQILNENPYNELAWFNLGTAYQGLKLYEKSIDAYQYAIAIDDKFEYAYRNMGDAFIRLHKYKEAVETLQRHLEIAKPEDVIYEAIGHCFEKQKKFTQARYYYRKASHLSPHDDKLYYRVAQTYMQEKNWENAIKLILSSLKINRNHAEYCLALGECFQQIDDYQQALTYFFQAIRIRPSGLNPWISLIRCLFLSGSLEEALIQLKQAEKNTGRKPVYQYYSVAVLLALGRTREALQHLENALCHAPRQVKKLIELQPTILQHPGVVDLIAKYRHKK